MTSLKEPSEQMLETAERIRAGEEAGAVAALLPRGTDRTVIIEAFRNAGRVTLDGLNNRQRAVVRAAASMLGIVVDDDQ